MSRDLTMLSYERGIKALQIMWGAMIFSVAVYAAIAWMVKGSAPTGGVGGAMTISLGAVSAALFLAQIKIHQNLKDEKLFPRILDLGSWGMRAEVEEKFQELEVPERGIQLILQAHVIFSIVIWAMAEAVAIFGLVLSLLNGDPRLMGIFGFVSLAQFIYFRPKGEEFKQQVKRWEMYVATNRGKWEVARER